MRKILIVLLFFFSITTAFSQSSVNVTGQLRDASTLENLAFTNITVQNATDNSMVTGAITDDNGRFEILGLSTGKYTLLFSFIGYETVEKPLIAGGLNSVFDLGQILLQPSAEQLNEVQIIGLDDATNSDLNKK
jgi:hypothetical protein